MIKPLIQPRRISRPASGIASNPISGGLIVAARNSVNKVQESTQKISKGLNKDQKFTMNYVEFFGSKKTTKILKKNLKSIRESLTNTFSMAKTLKKRVADISKTGLGGGAIGGVLGILGKGLLGGILGKVVLGALIGLAVGGIGYFLYKNTGRFFQFLRENIDQLTPIIQQALARAAEKVATPTGTSELIDELSKNVDLDTQIILEENPDMSREDAVSMAVLANVNTLQSRIDELVEDRKKLNKVTQLDEVTDINKQIQLLESGQKFLRTGNQFLDPISSAFLSQNFGGKFAPIGYDKLPENERLKTVVNYVETSPQSLDVLKLQLLQSSKLGGDDSKMRFYEDALNYIEAKQQNKTDEFIKQKGILPEAIDVNKIRRENTEQLKNEYPNILNPKSQPKEKKNNNINIIQSGSGNKRGSGANKNANNNLLSSKPDSGIIDVAFLSSLNSDMAMERGTSKSNLGIYMG